MVTLGPLIGRLHTPAGMDSLHRGMAGSVGLFFSRALINTVWRAGHQSAIFANAANRLTGLRGESESKHANGSPSEDSPLADQTSSR